MKNGHQQLLSTLQADPFLKDSISIQVKRIFTDVNGTIINKAAAPVGLQTSYPVYLFGEFDRQGAYSMGGEIVPAVSNSYKFLHTGVWGVNFPYFFGFNPAANIQTQISRGDLVTVYVDDLNIPNTFIFIVLTSQNVAIGSLNYDSGTHEHKGLDSKRQVTDRLGKMLIDNVQYFSNNVEQWKQAFTVAYFEKNGNYKYDSLDPFSYKPVTYVNQDFILLPLRITLSQYIGLYTLMEFETDNLLFNFGIKR